MTTFTDEVRDTYTGKFNSRRAVAAHLLSLDTSYLDEVTGSVQCGLWIGRIDRNLLIEDSQGFVECERYATDLDAEVAFAIVAQELYENGWEDA